jgi:acid phosphatase family membrane protein YuiD
MLNIQAISSALIISVAIQISCQAFKVVFYSIRNRTFEWEYFFSAGGMPSSHTVTIYDSIRLRGAVQTHSEVLLKLVKLLPKEERTKIPLRVGHSMAEIGIGIVVGGGLACLASFLY